MSEEFTCPSGHRLPVEQFHSYVDLTKQGDEAVLFACPGGKRGHQFNLAKAAASGMFSSQELIDIRALAADTVRKADLLDWHPAKQGEP